MKTLTLNSEQSERVKQAYAELDKAQRIMDRAWSAVDRKLLEIAKELGLENLSETYWGENFKTLCVRGNCDHET